MFNYVDDVEFVNSFSTFAVVVLLAESFIVEDFSSKTEVEEVTAFLSAVVAAVVPTTVVLLLEVVNVKVVVDAAGVAKVKHDFLIAVSNP